MTEKMAFDLNRVKAVCFDVDGTLSDTDNEWVDRVEKSLFWLRPMLKKDKLHQLSRWVVMLTGSPMNAVHHILDYLSLDDNFARFYEHRIRNYKHKPRPFWLMADAFQLLDLLKPRFPLSIVSARDELTTFQFIDQFKLGPFFQYVATAQTCEHTKPFKDPILWAAHHMKVDPKNCVMVGDTTVDILAGRAAGAQTIGVLCGFGTRMELNRAGADLIVNDLKELLSLFSPTTNNS